MSHSPRSPRYNTHTHFLPLWFCCLLHIHVSRSLSFPSVLVCDMLPRRLCHCSPLAHCPKGISVTILTSNAWEDTRLIWCLSYPSARCRSPHPSRVQGSPHPFSKKGAGSRSPYQFFSNCLWCGEARCVYHKGKTFVVYHKATDAFPCGIFYHKPFA